MKEGLDRGKSVLITGAEGYIGRQLVRALDEDRRAVETLIAADVRQSRESDRLARTHYVTADIRSPELKDLFGRFQVDTVVHLATIVTPGRKSDRRFEYSVDVEGTSNVIRACLQTDVKTLIITSSGAAYGYHSDNPPWLDETDALRGNPEFAYSDHKRLVEEMLAQYRRSHPQLKQLILRPGTVLGATANNQITALFEKPYVMGLRGAASPFVLIWDQDVVGCILRGIHEELSGIYNVAGDGVLSLREMAHLMNKPYISLPVSLVKGALWALKGVGLTQYGPEQVDFLRYRPVLSNRRLKEEFGYIPRMTTQQVFQYYLEHKRQAPG